jgi:hypothetical protein
MTGKSIIKELQQPLIESYIENPTELADKLLKATERSCIVQQTLLRGTPVNVNSRIIKCD